MAATVTAKLLVALNKFQLYKTADNNNRTKSLPRGLILQVMLLLIYDLGVAQIE